MSYSEISVVHAPSQKKRWAHHPASSRSRSYPKERVALLYGDDSGALVDWVGKRGLYLVIICYYMVVLLLLLLLLLYYHVL